MPSGSPHEAVPGATSGDSNARTLPLTIGWQRAPAAWKTKTPPTARPQQHRPPQPRRPELNKKFCFLVLIWADGLDDLKFFEINFFGPARAPVMPTAMPTARLVYPEDSAL